MSEHRATILWTRTTESFAYDDYNRNHSWAFDNGHVMAASAAVAFRGDPAAVDPEEAFVAALSSCHMLTFLAIGAKKRLTVNSYVDDAVGHLAKNAAGKLAVTRVELRPRVAFAAAVDAETLDALHHRAHEECFIANSVTTEIVVISA